MKKYFLLAGLLGFLVYALKAQQKGEESAQSLLCIQESVSLLQTPGKNARSLGTILFGEAVLSNGETRTTTSESQRYIKVTSVDGKVGWVQPNHFVSGIGLGVVLQNTKIYQRPKTITTITPYIFQAGELVIVENVVDTWVEMGGMGRTKTGWVEGRYKVSMKTEDVQFAALLLAIETDLDNYQRKEKLLSLMEEATQAGSPVAQIIHRHLYPDGQMPTTVPPSETNQEEPAEIAFFGNTTQTSRDISNTNERQTVETGGIYLVAGPTNPDNIFFAYHKTLPLGSRIRVQFPDNPGYVELEIINRLKMSNPNLIGLSAECIQAIYGDYVPSEISISYPSSLVQP